MFFLLIKLLIKNLTIFNLNKSNEQHWFAFTIIFIISFTIFLLLNIAINFHLPDFNPILFHIGTTLILFPIISSSLDLIFFITKLIKADT